MRENIVTTPTNTGSVANRKVFGVSGNNYLFLIGGGLTSLVFVHFAMNVGAFGQEWNMITRLLICFSPGIAAFLYVYGFLEGKEPYYQSDVVNAAIEGRDFNVTPPKSWGTRPVKPVDRERIDSLHLHK